MAETAPDIESGRLSAAELEANFADVEPPLDPRQALIESSRC
jgi:dihydropyrimidine dehydrogenase (NAD+) subunit PreT